MHQSTAVLSVSFNPTVSFFLLVGVVERNEGEQCIIYESTAPALLLGVVWGESAREFLQHPILRLPWVCVTAAVVVVIIAVVFYLFLFILRWWLRNRENAAGLSRTFHHQQKRPGARYSKLEREEEKKKESARAGQVWPISGLLCLKRPTSTHTHNSNKTEDEGEGKKKRKFNELSNVFLQRRFKPARARSAPTKKPRQRRRIPCQCSLNQTGHFTALAPHSCSQKESGKIRHKYGPVQSNRRHIHFPISRIQRGWNSISHDIIVTHSTKRKIVNRAGFVCSIREAKTSKAQFFRGWIKPETNGLLFRFVSTTTVCVLYTIITSLMRGRKRKINNKATWRRLRRQVDKGLEDEGGKLFPLGAPTR